MGDLVGNFIESFSTIELIILSFILFIGNCFLLILVLFRKFRKE